MVDGVDIFLFRFGFFEFERLNGSAKMFDSSGIWQPKKEKKIYNDKRVAHLCVNFNHQKLFTSHSFYNSLFESFCFRFVEFPK